MEKNRLEAFSDGVFAIIITIMVLELKIPTGFNFSDLRPFSSTFLSYVLSFVNVGIYWNNHHHMMSITNKINGGTLWANLHLLFWLSLTPYATGWLGESHFAKSPTTAFGFVYLMCGVAYWILQTQIVSIQGPNSDLATAIGHDYKGKASPILYLIAIGLSFWNQWAAIGIFIFTAVIWLVPDPRIERQIEVSKREVK